MVRSTLHYWLALKAIPRLSVAKKISLAEEVGLEKLFSPAMTLSVLGLSANQIAAIVRPNWQKIEAIIAACERCHCQIISFDDVAYPTQLKQIYDPPLVLFIQGNKALLSKDQLAIVGSRSASISGKEITKKLARELWQAGVVVTSGLAIGIDGYAHKAVVDCQGHTIAVVATGLDIVYPSRHKLLAHHILECGGAIVSEFPPGTVAKAGHFPKRNRIISGLSKGVLVVEAELKSGSLITARTALEQNREVFAVPGNIANPQTKGCHWLIKQGAKLVDELADIFNELEFTRLSGIDKQCNNGVNQFKKDEIFLNNEQKGLFIDPLLASVGDETTPVDIVVSRSQLPIEEVLSRLTMLELKGLVTAVPGGYQRLIKG